MRVPTSLSLAFGPEFEELIIDFSRAQGLLKAEDDMKSRRFLTRSIAPHVTKLSALFNRREELKTLAAETKIAARTGGQARPPELSLDPYWKGSSNPENLRLAYFLTFMPSNLYRVAAVWSELARHGFRWRGGDRLRALELGAGPAAGACGIAAGERFAPVGLPAIGDWALIEQDRASLELGTKWAERYFAWVNAQATPAAKIGEGRAAESEEDGSENLSVKKEISDEASVPARDWGTRPFHRKLTLDNLLPPRAPRFNLWVMSYFLNEFPNPPSEIADHLIAAWEKHLDEEGVVIIVEPALRLISRRLLELRRELLARKKPWLRVLLPCLGHQACGALADPEDWCHEEVSWWRPPYLKKIDELTSLDRKSLPFSYLVITRSRRELPELLPTLTEGARSLHRLVSPAHAEGKEREFFLCGQDGKRRARLRPESKEDPASDIGRGDVLVDAELRGDPRATRVERYGKLR